jgi:hypothetical protein
MNEFLKSPFPYFGGKRKVAEIVWSRFGKIANYVEPFFGSGAVLLNRPGELSTETINDKDGLVSNFWRALKTDPDAVAFHADWPVNENDLHARHAWLVGRKDSLQSKLEGDPDFFDVKVAGWWVWGMACWIGGRFCNGSGPWRVVEKDGIRQLVHLSGGNGVKRNRVHLSGGNGVNRQLVHLGGSRGVCTRQDLVDYFRELADRLKKVRVCCGDWKRVCGPSVTIFNGMAGVFLDPPYADTANRSDSLYRVDDLKVAHEVREWAIEQGKNPLMRIALCGYEGEHVMPSEWECYSWAAGVGYGAGAKEKTGNGKKERVWFSPHCERSKQGKLL